MFYNKIYQRDLASFLIFIVDKDVFIEHYRYFLSKRLLENRSYSLNLEKDFISFIKNSYGHQQTSKLEIMLYDISLAEININNVNCKILSAGVWPFKLYNVIVPETLKDNIKLINEEYRLVNPSRKLLWINQYDTFILKSTFSKKVYDIQVSFFQYVVLNLFNKNNKITFVELMEFSGLCKEILLRVLHSLSMVKYKILIKEDDYYIFNDAFTNSFKKFHIQMPILDNINVKENINENRTFLIESVIVRTMKSRKILKYQDLVLEVITQLNSFSSSSKDIKRLIESLIEKEYLERSGEDGSLIKYLA